MKGVTAELPRQLTREEIQRIFGFTAPQDLNELLRKCPRHYIRVSSIASLQEGFGPGCETIHANLHAIILLYPYGNRL